MEQLFSDDELALITEAAQESGMDPRDWVRAVVLQLLTDDAYLEDDPPAGDGHGRGDGRPPYRPDMEHAVWPVTTHRGSGRNMHELHHAGCWVPKGGEETMTTAQAREELLARHALPCEACQPERFLTPLV
ncbi:DUF6233 domain-containing protein [Streptomyces sp. XH2]|uniref:DUF6233 domain-containing protein n=1 Tax=Streptomyces sp. XH2 TaxID=3412483 RepID=UPI003C7E2418